MFEISVFLRERLLGRSTFSEEEVRIGRSADNELRIDNPALSRYHASIEAVAGIHVLKDFGSPNGTFINGERVAGRRGLNDGDRLQLGKFTLVFRTDKKSAAGTIDVRDQASYAVAGETMIMRGPAVDVRERACPWVGYLEDQDPAQAVPPRHLLNRDFVLLGASPGAHVPVRAAGVPERAALVVRTWQGFSLVALAPGVRRNKEAVELTATLQTGDELAVGPATFRFHAGRPGEH